MSSQALIESLSALILRNPDWIPGICFDLPPGDGTGVIMQMLDAGAKHLPPPRRRRRFLFAYAKEKLAWREDHAAAVAAARLQQRRDGGAEVKIQSSWTASIRRTSRPWMSRLTYFAPETLHLCSLASTFAAFFLRFQVFQAASPGDLFVSRTRLKDWTDLLSPGLFVQHLSASDANVETLMQASGAQAAALMKWLSSGGLQSVDSLRVCSG